MAGIRASMLLAVGLLLGGAGHAVAAWQQPVGGASPINHSPGGYAESPNLIEVAGVPYVAWDEYDGANAQIRVARLNGAGSDWEEVGAALNPASPINQSPTRQAYHASLTAVGGVPYVAWDEPDSVSIKIRVARPNAAGTGWDKVGASLVPPGPINQSLSQNAYDPSMATIAGVPYVAWSEEDGTNAEIRVARLNAAGTGWDKVGQTTTPASPINQSATSQARDPSLTEIGGVPYVAWSEDDGSNFEIRVARLTAAGTGWERVANSGSPLNQSNGHDADDPSLTVIGGIPYVAWSEDDGTNSEVRVARLNAAGTAWEKVGQSTNAASPINQSAAHDAEDPSLAAINGIPYVAWTERDGSGDTEIRVARLNATGAGWERVADSASPINQTPGAYVGVPSLIAMNGVPVIAWGEDDDASEGQTRVARLEPELVGQTATAGDGTASLSATWHTYGLPYPLGFDYGASLEQSTAPTPAAAGQDTVTVDQQVEGLSPSTTYGVRPFAVAGVAEPRVLGATAAFKTPPNTKIVKQPKNRSSKTKAKYKFKASERKVTFVCKLDKAKPKPCKSGKVKYSDLDDGKHKFRVYAVDAAGNRDPSPAKDKFKVL